MKLFVTGGAGFIGSNFIHYMLKTYEDYKVICIDKLTYAGNLSNLASAFKSPNFIFSKIDITNRAEIFTLFEKERPDIVINFAAESHVDRSIINPEVFLKTNIIGTQILMDACREYGVKRFHQISTDEVYGDLPLDRPDLFFTESSPLKPSSPYSVSKASADLLVLSYYKTFNLPITISRCTNNYGPYQFPEKLIPLMIVNALQNKYLPVYGDGKNMRTWLYVEDHCRAIDLIIHKGTVGEVYNISSGEEKTNLEVVQTIIDTLGKGTIKFVKERAGHDRRYTMDYTKITNELNWSPQTTFKTGLTKTIDWYLQNKPWWEDILNGKHLSYYDKLNLR